MMIDKNANVENYLKKVSPLLTCSRSKKAEILSQIRSSLLDIPGINEMTEEELNQITDSPEEVAEEYLADFKAKKVFGDIKNKKIFRIAIVAIALIVLILIGVYVLDFHSFLNGHYEVTPATSGTYTPSEKPGTRIY